MPTQTIITKLTKRLGRDPTADEIAKAKKKAKKEKKRMEPEDFEKKFLALEETREHILKPPDVYLGPTIEKMQKKSGNKYTEKTIWQQKCRAFLRLNVTSFIRQHFDELEVLASSGTSRQRHIHDTFMIDAFFGKQFPTRLPISKLTTILEKCLRQQLAYPHAQLIHRRFYGGIGGYRHRREVKCAIITYVSSKLWLHEGNDLRIVGPLATKFYKCYNEWKEIDRSPTTLFKQYVKNCEQLQQNYTKEIASLDEKILKLKNKFVKQFKTGDIISFVEKKLKRYAIIERTQDTSVIILYYLKTCDDDTFPYTFETINKSFLSVFGKWESGYLTRIFDKNNSVQKKQIAERQWSHDFDWDCVIPNDIEFQRNDSLAHVKASELPHFSPQGFICESKLSDLVKKHRAFLAVTSSNCDILKVQNPFFLFLNVRRVDSLPSLNTDVNIINKLKLMPPEIINEVVMYHHNYFACLDYDNDYYRVHPVLSTFQTMYNQKFEPTYPDDHTSPEWLLRSFFCPELGRVASRCDLLYLAHMKEGCTDAEYSTKLCNFSNSDGVKIYFRGSMPRLFFDDNRLRSVSEMAFQFLQTLCKHHVNFVYKINGCECKRSGVLQRIFYETSSLTGDADEHQYNLSLKFPEDSLIFHLDLFSFEIRIPLFEKVCDSPSKGPGWESLITAIDNVIRAELKQFFDVAKKLCNFSVKKQKMRGIFPPAAPPSDETDKDFDKADVESHDNNLDWFQ